MGILHIRRALIPIDRIKREPVDSVGVQVTQITPELYKLQGCRVIILFHGFHDQPGHGPVLGHRGVRWHDGQGHLGHMPVRVIAVLISGYAGDQRVACALDPVGSGDGNGFGSPLDLDDQWTETGTALYVEKARQITGTAVPSCAGLIRFHPVHRSLIVVEGLLPGRGPGYGIVCHCLAYMAPSCVKILGSFQQSAPEKVMREGMGPKVIQAPVIGGLIRGRTGHHDPLVAVNQIIQERAGFAGLVDHGGTDVLAWGLLECVQCRIELNGCEVFGRCDPEDVLQAVAQQVNEDHRGLIVRYAEPV